MMPCPCHGLTGIPPGVSPTPRGVVMCFECGSLRIFDAELVLRPATDAELAALRDTPAFKQLAQCALAHRRAQKAGSN